MRAPLAPSGLVDASGRSISRFEVDRVRARADVGGSFGLPAYESAGNRGTFLGEWPAQLQSADRAWLPARRSVTARVHDVVRNDPLGASARARRVNSAIGRGWRVKFRPNARALGIDLEVARELGAQLGVEFHLYANSHSFQSDAERRLTFSQQLRLTASHIMLDGEALGLGEWAGEEETRYKTRLRMVAPARLCNPNGRQNTDRLRDGVEYNTRGAPVRYHLRERVPGDYGLTNSFTWKAFDRWTAWGRPQVFHCFEVEQAGQSRGVSRFVAALKSFRAFAKYTDATLQSATINALIVGYLKSNAGPAAVSESFEVKDAQAFESERQAHYDSNPIKLAEGAILPVLPPGDEIKLETASRDVGSYDAFVRAIIRLIAAALGVTYEELSMDYSQTNYSSARAALIHAWAETQSLMGLIEDQMVRPFVVAWSEEAFDRGYVEIPDGAPDFYDAVDAYTQIHCIGPGRGYIDPTKEIDAAAARIEAGVSTLEDECEDQGKDYEEVQEQRYRELAREKELQEKYGVAPPAAQALARAAETSRDPAHNAALDQRAAA
jgi:lambda family phage portal protein